jgi:ATP-dependent Clp protease adapter protein ClpS
MSAFWSTLFSNAPNREQPAIVETTTVGEILGRYRRTHEVDPILSAAWQDAVMDRVETPTPARLLLAALEDDRVASCFADAAGARRTLEATIASASDWHERPVLLDQVLAAALTRTRERAQANISRGDLFHGISATGGAAARLLAASPIDLGKLDAPDDATLRPAAGADDGEVAVHVLDDDASTTEAVARTLEEAFTLPRRRAWFLMYRSHCLGNARVGVYGRAEADDRLAHARRLAEARRVPLRFATTKI